ncbi:MAG TPA: MotA/TolQ/ExbB proton channel family protein [Planctomycetes bacterium]|nr:MotA/TolQ/ExbB proton channel family protein [Planctomycetaceae bacterium]HIN53260.1 MotA/TolQ/ExbB proton channel family protein [Planctomycetota bacterium]
MVQLAIPAWPKWILTGLTALALVVGLGDSLSLNMTSVAVAQDELPEENVPEEDAAEPAPDNEENEAAAADAAAGETSYLAWVFEALGVSYMLIFLGLSFTLVALFVMNLITSARSKVCPVHLVEDFEEMLDNKQYQDAYELAKEHESVLGSVLSAGLAKLSAGYPQAIEAMQEIGEEENMKLEHRLSYMALIGTISPMVGLFGTVHGMISAFQVIATGGSTPEASELAGGISTALFTTLLGLAIAIPAIAVYNILKNRVARLMLEVGILSEGLMGRFEGVGKK